MNDDIFSLENAAMERWRNGDPMGFVELCAEEIIYIDPGLNKPITGLEEYRAYMKPIVGLIQYQKSEFISPKLVRLGEATLLTYNYRSSHLDPDGNFISETPWNCTEVYFQRKEEWKIVHTHWSFTKHKVREKVEVPLPVQSVENQFEGVLGELMALEQTALERWRKGDPWGYIDLYAPEVTYFDTGTPQRINGKEEMRALYEQLEGKISYEMMDFVDPRVLVSGDLAVLFYRFLSTRLNMDGSVFIRIPWNCTEIYQKTGGNWKIIHNHWSLIMGERGDEHT